MRKQPLLVLATLAALVGLAIPSMFGATPAAMAAPATQVLAAGTGNGTALLVGGTGQPQGTEIAGTVGMKHVQPGSKVIALNTPASFAPAYGQMSYDESKNIGAGTIVRQIKSTPGRKTLVVYSASAVSADIAVRRLRIQGYDMSELRIIKMGNPRRNGTTRGIETVYPTFRAPGVTSGGAEMRSNIPTVDHCVQYDPICDMPGPGSPAASYVNAVLCYFVCHSHYGSGELNRRNAVVERRGNTTYVTYRRQAPLTEMTGIPVPNSLGHSTPPAPSRAPVAAPRPVAAIPAHAPTPAPLPMVVIPPVHVPAYVPPPPPTAPVVTQRQVQQVAQQITHAVPQAAPVVKQITSHPAVAGFLRGLPK